MTDYQRRLWMERIREYRADMGDDISGWTDEDLLRFTSPHVIQEIWLYIKRSSLEWNRVIA